MKEYKNIINGESKRAYKRIAPFSDLCTTNIGVFNKRYKETKAVMLLPYGTVILAPYEGTVIVADYMYENCLKNKTAFLQKANEY
ncbi:MAG: hypothetical protein R3Y43_01580 [Alphaproteobacteria bacterium]